DAATFLHKREPWAMMHQQRGPSLTLPTEVSPPKLHIGPPTPPLRQPQWRRGPWALWRNLASCDQLMPTPQDDESANHGGDGAGSLVRAIQMDRAAKKGRDDTPDNPQDCRQHEAPRIIRRPRYPSGDEAYDGSNDYGPNDLHVSVLVCSGDHSVSHQ